MKLEYKIYRPRAEAAQLIERSVEILEEFESQGFSLTLRQLYYQLVAAGEIPNKQRTYDRLGDIISRARLGGLIDWKHIVDRTRVVHSNPHWQDGAQFLRSVAPQFQLDLWEGQRSRVFVFVEKQALEEVVASAAEPLDCPYFANKGYLSSSSAWRVAHDLMLLPNTDAKHDADSGRGIAIEQFVVLHLGDHDPSGLDMTRDIEERLNMFAEGYEEELEGGGLNCYETPEIEVRRIALNLDQIAEYDPPPNPAKETDSRYEDYVATTGLDESWELDALPAPDLAALVNDEIAKCIDDPGAFEARQKLQAATIGRLSRVKLGESD